MPNGSILIVGGYGVVGSRIAADLAPDFPGHVIVAGRHPDRAAAAAKTIGHGVRGRRIDVTDPASIADALDGVSIAVNCIDDAKRALLWGVIGRGLAFTDITPHLVDLGRGDAYEQIDAMAKTAGARIVLGTGMVPGISSVMVRALADRLGGADRIETALSLHANDLSGPASFDYLLRELTMRFTVHVNGVDRQARAFTQPRIVEYPTGARRAYLFPFSDQVLYPRTMGARTVLTRLSIDPPGMGRLLALLVGARLVRLAALARGRRQHTAAPFALRVDVTYGNDTATATLTGREQARATALGASGVARALATGDVTQPGAWMPEQVIDPGSFFERLNAADLHVELPPERSKLAG